MVALYLKTFQALSFARLSALFEDVFGLKISPGARARMPARSDKPFAAQKPAIIARRRRAEMLASDETGSRIEALNSYQWVFLSPDPVVHQARMSRAGQVVGDVMAGHRARAQGEGLDSRRPVRHNKIITPVVRRRSPERGVNGQTRLLSKVTGQNRALRGRFGNRRRLSSSTGSQCPKTRFSLRPIRLPKSPGKFRAFGRSQSIHTPSSSVEVFCATDVGMGDRGLVRGVVSRLAIQTILEYGMQG